MSRLKKNAIRLWNTLSPETRAGLATNAARARGELVVAAKRTVAAHVPVDLAAANQLLRCEHGKLFRQCREPACVALRRRKR